LFANGIGWPHLLIMAAVFVLLFGAKRLPDSARSLGKSLRIFKAEMSTITGSNPPATKNAPVHTEQSHNTAADKMS
jgi:sec-independent protein translocase protein TatA